MVVNFDFDAFFDELKATKPPYKCPFKDCEKVYKTYTGIQYHVVTLHQSSNKTAKWHHRQMRCPITPPKSVSSTGAASEGEGELAGDGEGRLEVEFGESKFVFNDVDNLEIEISSVEDEKLQFEANLDGPKPQAINQLPCNMNEAEQILKEEPRKPLPVPIFSSLSSTPNGPKGFVLPTGSYIVGKTKDETEEEKYKYLIDEEDKRWLGSVSSETGGDVDESKFEVAMETLEKESALVTRCENRNHASNGDEEGGTHDDNAVCSVCGDGSCHASNAILFCDMCDMAVHQECYGVPYVPEGQWLCRRCLHSPSKTVQCCLCPCPGGALKQTSDGRWAHVLCSAWVPEVNFANPVFLEPVEGLENIPPARWRLVCFLCRRRKVGACIQCHRPNCYMAFHVTCALFAGMHLEMTQRGVDKGLRGILIPGHSSGNVRKTAYCDLHAPEPGKSGKSSKREDAASEGGDEESEPVDEGRKLLGGDDEGDDDYDPGNLGRSKMDAVTKSRSVMSRVVASKIKRIVGVLSYPTISQESLAKVAIILGMEVEDSFVQRLKNYWMLKRLSRNGVPLIRGLQPNLVPKKTTNREKDADKEDEAMDEDEHPELMSSDEQKAITGRPGQSLTKYTKEEDDTVMLSLTCVNDDDGDDDDDVIEENGSVQREDAFETSNEDTKIDHQKGAAEDMEALIEKVDEMSTLQYSDDEDDDKSNSRHATEGSRKRKLVVQDVPNKRPKLVKQVDDHSQTSRSKKPGSYSRRLRFYADPRKVDAGQDGASEEVSQGEQQAEGRGEIVKRSKRMRKMSSALFDFTYFGSVQKRRSNTKSEEEKSSKVDQSFSSITDDSFTKEPMPHDDAQKKMIMLKTKVLLNGDNKANPVPDPATSKKVPGKRGRKKKVRPDEEPASSSTLNDEATTCDEPGDDLCGAKHLREDLSKVKKILELVTQREECKLEEVRVKTRMYSLKLDPLTPILTRTLEMLQEKDNHKFFADPVDTEEVSDYLEYISRPMDFGTMRGKIARHEYSSLASFEKDFELIVGNCLTYNAAGTVYYNAAVRLRNQGKSILNEARKAEEQLNSLKKLKAPTSSRGTYDDDDDDDASTRSSSAHQTKETGQRGLRKEAINKGDYLASIMARIELVQRKLDSSTGFLRETYSRQLKHLNRQMSALKGRAKTSNPGTPNGSWNGRDMPDLISEEGQNGIDQSRSGSKPKLATCPKNGANRMVPSQTAPSPTSSSSSFSNSPPSLSPQAASITSSRVSSATPPPLLSSSILPTPCSENADRRELVQNAKVDRRLKAAESVNCEEDHDSKSIEGSGRNADPKAPEFISANGNLSTEGVDSSIGLESQNCSFDV